MPGAEAHFIDALFQEPKGPCSLRNEQKQILCGNDRQKSNGKCKGKSRFPMGMTGRKARVRPGLAVAVPTLPKIVSSSARWFTDCSGTSFTLFG